MHKIGYVCTSFGNSSVTLASINSFLSAFPIRGIVIVVDNGSPESDLDALQNCDDQNANVFFLRAPQNLGYFAGLNFGLEFLSRHTEQCEWVFAGNNDLLFDSEITQNLANRAQGLLSYPVVAPNILRFDGAHQNPHVVSRISKTRQLLYKLYYSSYFMACILLFARGLGGKLLQRPDTENWKVECNIWAPHGACIILTPLFFKKYLLLPAESFLYFEEFFLARQISKGGDKIRYCPDLIIHHVCNATISQLPGKRVWKYSQKAYRTWLGLSNTLPRKALNETTSPKPRER